MARVHQDFHQLSQSQKAVLFLLLLFLYWSRFGFFFFFSPPPLLSLVLFSCLSSSPSSAFASASSSSSSPISSSSSSSLFFFFFFSSLLLLLLCFFNFMGVGGLRLQPAPGLALLHGGWRVAGVQGCLAHKKQPTPLGLPQGPRHSLPVWVLDSRCFL